MSQKVNPIAMRLRLNRNFDSCWYSDYYYGQLLYRDHNLRDYLFSLQGFRPGKCIIHHFTKKTVIHFFFLEKMRAPDSLRRGFSLEGGRGQDLDKGRGFSDRRGPILDRSLRPCKEEAFTFFETVQKLRTRNKYQAKSSQVYRVLLSSKDIQCHMYNSYIIQYFFHNSTSLPIPDLKVFPSFLRQGRGQASLILKETPTKEEKTQSQLSAYSSRVDTVRKHYYLSKIESLLSNNTHTLTSVQPIKMNSIYQTAYLVAEDISNKLEQKKAFRQICRLVFSQIEKCQYIKGIRIRCSGRLNGAEIAKAEWKQHGETSLHVFSNCIDYAQSRALTPYGILGVQVWVSYQKER